MPAVQVELVQPSRLNRSVEALVDVFDRAPVVEKRRAFREVYNHILSGIFFELHTPSQALYLKAAEKINELPLANPMVTAGPEFELQSEVNASLALMRSVLPGEGAILSGSNPVQVAETAARLDPFNEYFIRGLPADNAQLAGISAANGLESLDFAAFNMVNRNKYRPGTNDPNPDYAKIPVGFYQLLYRGRAAFVFDVNVRKGLVGERQNIDYIFWISALMYLAAMAPSQKWGMIDGRYGFTFPMSKFRPDLVIRGAAKAKPYIREQSDTIVLPGAHALDFYTWKCMQGTPDDPDTRPVLSADVALDQRFLIKADRLRAAFTNYVPKDFGAHYGKYLADLATMDPKVLATFGDAGMEGFFQEVAKKPTLIEVPRAIRAEFYLSLAKLMFEWNLPPNPRKTRLYSSDGPVRNLEEMRTNQSSSYNKGDIKRQLMRLAEMGLLDSGLPPDRQKQAIDRLAGEFFNILTGPGQDALLFAWSLLGNFAAGAGGAAFKTVTGGK